MLDDDASFISIHKYENIKYPNPKWRLSGSHNFEMRAESPK